MTTEVMRNKREFNARARELVAEGCKVREFENFQCFSKHIYAREDFTVKLVKGWKKNA